MKYNNKDWYLTFDQQASSLEYSVYYNVSVLKEVKIYYVNIAWDNFDNGGTHISLKSSISSVWSFVFYVCAQGIIDCQISSTADKKGFFL